MSGTEEQRSLTPPPLSDEEPVKILIVDDQPANLIYLRRVLARPGYDVVAASGGEQALALARQQEFAVILLDVQMPVIDGFEVARRLRDGDPRCTTPVVFVTSSADNADWVYLAYSVGAVDFLPKPIDRHAVRGKVAVFVELFRGKRQLQRQSLLLQEMERREGELALARVGLEHEQRYRHLADALPNVVWTASAVGRIDFLNRRWFEMTGVAPAAAMEHGWLANIHAEDREPLLERWGQAAQTAAELDIECRLVNRAGSFRWQLARAQPAVDPEGRIVRWSGSFTDIDEQKQANEQSQAAVRARDEFLSIASHELRTPLTSLQLQLDSVIRTQERQKRDEPLEGRLVVIRRQVTRLSVLIDSLLDVSRITTGHLELRRERLDLAEVVREMTDALRESAKRAGCELGFHAEGPLLGDWDGLRMGQVVSNLVGNAIKYAPGKPIDVRLRSEGGRSLIVITDHGMGIAPEHLQRIFDRFERAVSVHNYGGLGLGLYVASRIAQAHGGRIEVHSDPGAGSIFTIVLPEQANAAVHDRHASPAA